MQMLELLSSLPFDSLLKIDDEEHTVSEWLSIFDKDNDPVLFADIADYIYDIPEDTDKQWWTWIDANYEQYIDTINTEQTDKDQYEHN